MTDLSERADDERATYESNQELSLLSLLL